MRTVVDNRKWIFLAIGFSIAVFWGSPPSSNAQTASVEPKADQILLKMSDYLAGLEQFSVQTENSLEVILRSGQKIQFDNPAKLLVQRPNMLHAAREGDIENQQFYYNGKTLTLYMADEKSYATVEAPPTIEKALDFARESLDVHAPAADLIYKNAYSFLMEDIVSGSYIGLSVVGGVTCHHLAFRGNEVDWQIWVEDNDKPLPRKFIITSKWIAGAPQFTTFIKGWNLTPEFTKEVFTFVPPGDAQQVDFVQFNHGGRQQP